MNEIDPMVSICCQTYNHVNYIEEALEGFLIQKTDFEYEILLRDDASTDGTAEICKAYASKYPDKINLLAYKENQWQKGVQPFPDNVTRAKGKYIAICEGDDYWTDPYKLQKQVDFLEANQQYSICFTYSNKIDEKGNIIEHLRILKNLEYKQYDFLIGNKYQTRTATILIRSDILKNNYWLNYKVHNGDTWLKILATKDYNGIVLPYISAAYRIHPGGIWSNIDKIQKNKKNYNDWHKKLLYALNNCPQAIPVISIKLIKAFSKWLILSIQNYLFK